MASAELRPDQVAALGALANGIIPADDTDAGAACVGAGPRLAERVRGGVNAAVYLRGLELAEALSQQTFGRPPAELAPADVHGLLALLRERDPAFFKQLRLDVSAMYLSDPAVWQRIGFPGPSTESGGYPDFDQPQTQTMNYLKEAPRHDPPHRPPGR